MTFSASAQISADDDVDTDGGWSRELSEYSYHESIPSQLPSSHGTAIYPRTTASEPSEQHRPDLRSTQEHHRTDKEPHRHDKPFHQHEQTPPDHTSPKCTAYR